MSVLDTATICPMPIVAFDQHWNIVLWSNCTKMVACSPMLATDYHKGHVIRGDIHKLFDTNAIIQQYEMPWSEKMEPKLHWYVNGADCGGVSLFMLEKIYVIVEATLCGA